jgi:hypothetical protein
MPDSSPEKNPEPHRSSVGIIALGVRASKGGASIRSRQEFL